MIRRLLVVFNLLAVLTPAFSQTCDTSLWSPNGKVNSIVLRDSLLYVGGDFSQVSPVTGRFVRLDSVTAAVSHPFPYIGGKVNCMAKDSLGRIYVGGAFSQVGRLPIRNLFRLDTLGNVDPSFVMDPDGEVFTLSTDSNRLWVGGDFLNIGGFSRMRGAAFHVAELSYYVDSFGDSIPVLVNGPDTLTNFDPMAQGPIYSLCLDSAGLNVLAVGDFAGIGGFPITYIAKLKPATGHSAPLGNSFWQSSPNANGPVRAVRTHGNRIYVAGDFTALGLEQRHGLAVIRFDNGQLLTTDSLNQPAYNAGINGPVHDIELIDDQLYIAGNFGIVDGAFRSNIACLDTMFHVQAWIADTDKEVFEIQSWGNNILCFGGDFHLLNGDTVMNLALVDRSTASLYSWNAMFDGIVYAIMPAANGKLYAGGSFNGAGGVLRDNLCAININTRRPISWSPKMNDAVQTIYADANTLYVAGDFTEINQLSRDRLASFTLASLSLTGFDPGVNGTVRTMTGDQSKLYLGGNFSTLGGQTRNNIGCIDLNTQQVTNWDPGCAGTVNKLILENNWLYIGGFFSQVGGQQRANLARVNATTGVTDWNWICDTDNGVYDIELYNGNLYFGGWFDHVSGQPRNHLAAADTSTAALQSFNPGVNDYVRCFARWNDDLFIGGAFTTVSTASNYPRLANYDLGDAQYDNWAPYPNIMPVTLQASQYWLFAGGSFSSAGSHFQPHLAMLSVNFVTGIPQQSFTSSEQLQVYPNPANEELFLVLPSNMQHQNCILEITDMCGRTMRTENRFVSSSAFSVLLQDLSSGTYFIRVIDESGNLRTARFVHP